MLESALIGRVDPLDPKAKAAWVERARRLRDQTRGRNFTPSEDLIREMRDDR